MGHGAKFYVLCVSLRTACFVAPCGITLRVKWFKPAPMDVRIFLKDKAYEPDFVVETSSTKYLAEPKAANEMESTDVREKARAAAAWCAQATAFEVANDGKPWKYLLIPHDEIVSSASLAGLAARFAATPS